MSLLVDVRDVERGIALGEVLLGDDTVIGDDLGLSEFPMFLIPDPRESTFLSKSFPVIKIIPYTLLPKVSQDIHEDDSHRLILIESLRQLWFVQVLLANYLQEQRRLHLPYRHRR